MQVFLFNPSLLKLSIFEDDYVKLYVEYNFKEEKNHLKQYNYLDILTCSFQEATIIFIPTL